MVHPPTRLLTGQFAVLMVGGSLFFGGFGILNALTPPYVVDVLDGSEASAGLVMGSLAVTSLVARPFLGRIGDRHGARRILLLGAAIGVVSMLLLLFGPETVATALLSRLVLGAGAAAMFTGTALLSITLAPPGRHGQAASLMLISVHVGLGIGPVLGLRIEEAFGYGAVWSVVAVAAALSGLVLSRLRSIRPAADHAPGPLIHGAALAPGVVTLFGVFGFNGFLTFASLYGREIGVEDVALLFTVASGTIVVVRATAGHVPDLIGPIRAGSGALVATGGACLLLAFWSTPTGAFVGAALLAAGMSLQTPSFMPLAVADVPDHERGSAMATFTGFYDIANAIVGPLVGLIVAAAGYRSAFVFSSAMTMVALVLLRALIAPKWRATHRPVDAVANPASSTGS